MVQAALFAGQNSTMTHVVAAKIPGKEKATLKMLRPSVKQLELTKDRAQLALDKSAAKSKELARGFKELHKMLVDANIHGKMEEQLQKVGKLVEASQSANADLVRKFDTMACAGSQVGDNISDLETYLGTPNPLPLTLLKVPSTGHVPPQNFQLHNRPLQVLTGATSRAGSGSSPRTSRRALSAR